MDIALAFTEAGSGTPLILLHGNGEDGTYSAPPFKPWYAPEGVHMPAA